MTKKILITDYCHEMLIDGLEQCGFEVAYDTSITMDLLPKIISSYEGIIINSKIKMTSEVIDLAPHLKFIGRLGSGMEIIDVPYATSKGIYAFNSPEGNRNAVAEHAIGMMLALYNNMMRANDEVKNFEWHREKNRGLELKNKTLGIIGLGNTGSLVAKKMSSWELDIIYFDKYREHLDYDPSYITKVSFEDILIESDIITLHIPLTSETKHMVNENFLQMCRKKPILINTSRGKIVDTKALVDALDSGLLFGCGLDVFENEKTSSYTSSETDLYQKLMKRDNVIVSPHVAGWTKESLEGIATTVLDKIKKCYFT